jgi:hypothetical protein
MKKIGLACVAILIGLSLAGCNNLASQSHKAASSSSTTSTKVVKRHKTRKKTTSESRKDKQSNGSSQLSGSAVASQQSNSGQHTTVQSNNNGSSNQQQSQGSGSQQGGINNADQALAAARAKYGDGNGNYHWTVMYDADTGQPIRNDDGSYFVKAIDPTQGTMTGTAQSVNVYPDGSMTNN